MKNESLPSHLVIKDGIHGLGVISKDPIKQGEMLFKLEGEILNSPTRTSIQVGINQHIESWLGAHVNHCCFPTAKVDQVTQSLVSTREIQEGEEITFDYNASEDKLAAPFKCHCCGKEILGKKLLTSGVK